MMNQEKKEPRLLREQQVPTMLGISRSTFNRLRDKGAIPAPLRPSEGTTRWLHHEICDLIMKWAAEREQQPVHQAAIEEKTEIPRKRTRRSAMERRKPRVRHAA